MQSTPGCRQASVAFLGAVIATNWSGPTAFMDEGNSYPLPIQGLAKVASGLWADHQWAAPSVSDLKRLLRRVVTHPQEAAARGRCFPLRRNLLLLN